MKLILVLFIFLRVQSINLFRLPNQTRPLEYVINIDYEDRNNAFQSTSKIIIDVISRTSEIVVNMKKPDNSLTKSLYSLPDRTRIPISNTVYNDTSEQYKIYTSLELLENQKLELTISRYTNLREDKLGVYRSSYIDENGKTVSLATTQFAPTEARHGFACYDEPHLKAEFTLIIKHSYKLKAISNTEIDNIKEESLGVITTTFKKTPKISTYLVGFMIFDFANKILKTDKLEQRIYTRPNAIQNADFANEFSFNVLQKFQEYFQLDFSLNLMQQCAVPDFYFNGMENFGMVTYKERNILFNKEIHSVNHELNIVTLMSHEMAHQWFGDLVTMKWWTYVWLSEGFATLFGFMGPEMVSSDWNGTMEYFLISKMHFVLTIDSDKLIRPMTYYIETQKDIMANYDKIAYEKTACVLRMFQHALTEKVFKNGVNKYLKMKEFDSADEDDLFNAIQITLDDDRTGKIDIGTVMKSWTNQAGYPLVTVSRNDDELTITLNQSRFLDNRVTYDTQWWIPFNLVTAKNPDFTSTIPDDWMKNEITYKTPIYNLAWQKDDWIILNKQQTGYYRVNYDDENWRLLAEALKKDFKIIHINNRAQLIDDSFKIAFAGQLNLAIPFNIINYIGQETEYAPWAALENNLGIIKNYLFSHDRNSLTFEESESYLRYDNFVQQLVKPAYSRVGLIEYANETILSKLTRQIIVNMACEHNLEECITSTDDYEYPNMRAVYFCNRLRASDPNIIRKIRNSLQTITDPIVRSEILLSFGCSTNKIFLEYSVLSSINSFSEYYLNKEEKLDMLQGIYRRGQIGLDIVLEILLVDWATLKTFYPDKSLETIMLDAAKYVNNVNSNRLFMEVLNMIRSRNEITAETYSEARNTVLKNFLWISENREGLIQYAGYTGQASRMMKSSPIISTCLVMLWFKHALNILINKQYFLVF